MTWEKGKSGNPGGLTLRQSRTKRLIEGLGPVAVARLEQLLRSDNETVALGAAKEVLARVAPIPKQAKLDVTVEHGPNAHLAALISLSKRVAHNETTTPMLDITPKLGNDRDGWDVNRPNEQIDPLAMLRAQTEQVIEELVQDDEEDDPV